MSTRAFASTLIPVPIDQVWAQIRDFTFPAKFISTVANVQMEHNDNPRMVGGVRKMTWKDGSTRRHRLVGLNDMDYTMTWELMPNEGADVTSNVEGCVTTIQLTRISDTKQTVMSWWSVFSADVKGKTIMEEEQDYMTNLHEIAKRFGRGTTGTGGSSQ